MPRVLTVGNIYSKKFKTLNTTGKYKEILGTPEANGIWLIWGNEKNGKTWGALQLSEYLSHESRVLYISGEEGVGLTFVEACKRAGIGADNRSVSFLEYVTYTEITEKLDKRRSANIIFIDNCTVYKEEITFARLRELTTRYPTKLFVFLAHEERNEPYTALAKLVRKLAKVIFYVEGLRVTVSGRVPGGEYDISKKAELFHGTN